MRLAKFPTQTNRGIFRVYQRNSCRFWPGAGNSLTKRLSRPGIAYSGLDEHAVAHDKAFAIAAAARRGRLIGLGVDVERAEPLPGDVIDIVLSDAERREAANDGVAQRLVFVAKEAVYKAIHPLDGSWLDFPDIEVRLADGMAALRDGRRLRLITFADERLIAVALAEADGGDQSRSSHSG